MKKISVSVRTTTSAASQSGTFQHMTSCAQDSHVSPSALRVFQKKLSLGRKHGFADKEQGNLFFSIADIIESHEPSAFVLENVKHLTTHDQGRTFKVINDILDGLGYNVHPHIIDARGFVPQHRERIFLIGFKDNREFDLGDIPRQGPQLSSVLEKSVPEKYTLSDHLWKYLRDYAAKHRAAGNGFGYGLVTGRDTARTLSARYYKDGSEILISQGANKNPRRLTPRECARLMGFPDSFEIPVSDTQAYRQFGNSVVVPVVEQLAKAVVESLRRPTYDYEQTELPLQLRNGSARVLHKRSPN